MAERQTTLTDQRQRHPANHLPINNQPTDQRTNQRTNDDQWPSSSSSIRPSVRQFRSEVSEFICGFANQLINAVELRSRDSILNCRETHELREILVWANDGLKTHFARLVMPHNTVDTFVVRGGAMNLGVAIYYSPLADGLITARRTAAL